MERFTDAAQGYCEMYCKKYGHCFGDPGDCVFQDEVKIYEALKGYEFTGMSPANIRIMEISALREQDERRWIPVAERLPDEHESLFAHYKGTDKWCDGMFMTISDLVIVCAEYENMERIVKTANTTEGIWKVKDSFYPCRVTHWMPLPELPKGD